MTEYEQRKAEIDREFWRGVRDGSKRGLLIGLPIFLLFLYLWFQNP